MGDGLYLALTVAPRRTPHAAARRTGVMRNRSRATDL
jgi:hypothetical protein